MGALGLLSILLGISSGLATTLSVEMRDAETIVNTHNSLRASVKPEAADMKLMTWHDEAAKLAQSWAGECKRLTHNRPYDPVYGNCGQNILASTGPMSWSSVVKAWHSEVDDFSYGGKNDFAATGHYTQIVWAESHKVGCGVSACKDRQGQFYNYVCNYCPAGNFKDRLNRPYKRGTKCGTCPGSCFNGLCK